MTQAELKISVPPELEGGVYSNMQAVWHTAHEFTIDFTATQPPQKSAEGTTVLPCRVVARVRLPVGTVFALIKALNDNMTKYEKVFGEIRPPEPIDSGEGGQP